MTRSRMLLIAALAALAGLSGPAGAQMGPPPGMGPRKPAEAVPAPAAPKDPGPRAEPSAEVPATPGPVEPRPQAPLSHATGPTGAPMEHPAVSPPFYRERTFLVVASAILTGSGVVGYRALRARRQRARGPATFVTEAVLVVDLVESTRLATHYGDGLAMRARNALKDRALAIAARHGLAFSENTGDGCLMTFPSVGDAVETAIALLAGFRDRPVDLAPGPPLAVRAGIAYGEILLDARGARHGAVINKAFRLEGLGRDSLAPMGEEEGGREFPERDRIFLDEEAARELPAGMSQRVVGFTSLKGFSGLHRVYEVPSDPRS